MRNRLALLLISLIMLLVAGCSGGPEPIEDARETLGTAVRVTAYPSEDEDAALRALEESYTSMSETGEVLNAYADPDWVEGRLTFGYLANPNRNALSVTDFNRSPFIFRILPLELERVIQRIDALDVADQFSPSLFEVSAMYDFEGIGAVPNQEELNELLSAARAFDFRTTAGGSEARFAPIEASVTAGVYGIVPVGLDVGGAAKGYALDQGVRKLHESGAVDAALLTAGSTTVTYGEKQNGEPWSIGVEHPREAGALIATIETEGDSTVSTSGDYQRYFEQDDVRYHHILDPATGQPAWGLQSLTVVGAKTGLDSDILSTALFVMGVDEATSYAEEHGLGLVMVDDEGRVHVVPGPEDRTWEIITEEQ